MKEQLMVPVSYLLRQSFVVQESVRRDTHKYPKIDIQSVCCIRNRPKFLIHMIHTFLWLQNSSAWWEHHSQKSLPNCLPPQRHGNLSLFFNCQRPLTIHWPFILKRLNLFTIHCIEGLKVNIESNMAVPWPFSDGFVVAGRGLGQNLEVVIAWLSSCHPGHWILSLPSMLTRDWSLRPPPIKVLPLYKSSLYKTGRGLKPSRLSSTSPHSIATGIIAETIY